MSTTALSISLGGLLAALPWAKQRLALSRAKHRSLSGHSRMAKRVVSMIPGYAYTEAEFFNADAAPQDIVARRHAGLSRLQGVFEQRFAKSLAMTDQTKPYISDLQFISSYKVPYQFSHYLSQKIRAGSFLQSSQGVKVQDLDGNQFYDLTGSYGVNVLGYDFYKETMAQALQTAGALGPVLGAYHPCVLDNVQRLTQISGLDEVSFHMSGTEAVMQAVRMARYHTGKKYLVRFCGAYHGWWEDVQPGPGNPMPPRETYTLKDMDRRSLEVLRHRKDIACVLVNPLQALHPNASAPGDNSLIDSSRRAGFDRAAYTAWLKDLRQVCTEAGIALIFDEVFLGFRLDVGGAQAYFGVQADMVTYGKTLGGGFPIGVVCGTSALMKRFKPSRPADVCFARGTFKEHPYVMASMNAFLHALERPEIKALYEDQDARWNLRCDQFNAQMAQANLPIRAQNMSSVWTITYTEPSRYNWMLQFYLREQGLALSWVGSGRLIFSLNYTDEDFAEVTRRFVQAGEQMKADGWWWEGAHLSNKDIKRIVLKEMLKRRLLK